jgi:hypothetical protein
MLRRMADTPLTRSAIPGGTSQAAEARPAADPASAPFAARRGAGHGFGAAMARAATEARAALAPTLASASGGRAAIRGGGLAAETSAAALALQAARPAGAADAEFRRRIAQAEGSTRAPDGGWTLKNARSGALGRYQMIPAALRDIGWQDAAGNWTAAAARQGVASEADFLALPAAQEAAMGAYLSRTEVQLARNGSLARAGATVAGLDGGEITLTQAGLLAAAHRRGAGMVARYLAHQADAPLTPGLRSAFAQVERRLRDFG